jgi:hypothetical protein
MGRRTTKLPAVHNRNVRRLDDKSIVVEAQDTRIIDFRRTAETKFLKNWRGHEAGRFETATIC